MKHPQAPVASTVAASAEFLAAVLDHASDFVVVTDAAGVIQWANDPIESILGVPVSQALGDNVLAYVHPEEVVSVAASMMSTVSRAGRSEPLEIRVRGRDGTWLRCEVIGTNCLDVAPVFGMVWHGRDVSERMEVQRRYRRLFEESPTPTFLARVGLEGMVANEQFCALVGYDRETLLKMRVLDVVRDEGDRSRAWSFFERLSDSNSVAGRGDITVTRSDGSEFRAEVAVNAIREEDGDYTFVTTVYDVTEWRDAVHDRVKAEARLKAIADHSSDIVVLVERDGYWEANDTATRVLGYPKGFDPPEGPLFMVHLDDRERAVAALGDLFAGRWGEHDRIELRLVHVEGETREYEFRGRLNLAGDAVITARDLTQQRNDMQRLIEQERRIAREIAERERAELELRLEQALRLESVGRLAAGLAHDFNNLVGVILNYSSVLSRSATLDAAAAQDIAAIESAAEAAAGLANSLMQFGRVNAGAALRIDLMDVVGELAGLARATLRADQSCEFNVIGESAFVRMDRGQIEQVVMNLVLNARDAIDDWGHIEVTVRADNAEHVVAIEVADNGAGMTIDVKKRAFDPFFTTKPTGMGTGLGLAVVHGLVHAVDGTISLESEVGRGTRATVRIPRCDR